MPRQWQEPLTSKGSLQMKRTFASIFLLIAALAGGTDPSIAGSADVSEAYHTVDINNPLPPTPPSSIRIYKYKPSGNVKFIGVIYARGMATVDAPNALDLVGQMQEALSPSRTTEEDDIKLAMKALIDDAASIGANAIIIKKSSQENVSHNSTERRIEAFALYVEETAPPKAQPTTKAPTRCKSDRQCEPDSYCSTFLQTCLAK
jgi:uncharacterized protein YbjQ (UPF0145 family)